MKDIIQSRIASGLTVLLGIWLVLTPLAISMTGAGLVSIIVTGGVLAAAGLVQMFWFNLLPSTINILASIWLFISAFVFDMANGASWNMVIVAIVTFILAFWDGIEANEVNRERHHHVHV